MLALNVDKWEFLLRLKSTVSATSLLAWIDYSGHREIKSFKACIDAPEVCANCQHDIMKHMKGLCPI